MNWNFEELLQPRFYLPLSVGIVAYVLILFGKNIFLGRMKKVAEKTSTKLDDIFFEALSETKQFFIIAFCLYLGLNVSALKSKYAIYIDRTFVIILMFQFWIWGKKVISSWVFYTVQQKASDPSVKTTLNFLGIIFNLALLSVIILSTLANFGHDVSTLVAGLGIGGVAIALATKSLLEDLFSSLSIVLDKPFLVGDYISIGEWEGVVEYIGLKSTQIRSINGELILVSNSQLLAAKIRNYKRLKERRVSFNLEVELGEFKISAIPDLVRDALATFGNVKFERANLVSFTNTSASFEMVYWIESSKYKTYTQVHHDVLQKLYNHLEKNNLKGKASARV